MVCVAGLLFWPTLYRCRTRLGYSLKFVVMLIGYFTAFAVHLGSVHLVTLTITLASVCELKFSVCDTSKDIET